jgi:hypothetical protein
MPSFRKKPVDLVVDVRSHIEFWLSRDYGVCSECGTTSKREAIGKPAA